MLFGLGRSSASPSALPGLSLSEQPWCSGQQSLIFVSISLSLSISPLWMCVLSLCPRRARDPGVLHLSAPTPCRS